MEFGKIGVVGCGLMGHGITQVAAQAGCSVVCFDADRQALDRGMDRIQRSLGKLAEKAVERGKQTADEAELWAKTTRERVQLSTELGSLADCDLVIEAVVEDLDAKRSLFGELDPLCRPTTTFASNTSSYPIADLAAATNRADRFIGLHFFNPVQLMKLVEIVRIDRTDPTVLREAEMFVDRCGKTPIACRDTPGFVVNRLLVPFMVQAMLMLDRGDASALDIDTGMRLGCGHPMGPLTLADYVGLDTTLSIVEGWCARYPNEPAFQIPDCLRQKVQSGELGRKTGVGFYRWDGDTALPA